MRRIRLRWRLAFSHAALAVLLVAFAGSRIEAQTRVADRARTTAATERDADVFAARASRVMSRSVELDDLVADEQLGKRQAEVVTPDLSRVAGSDLAASGAGRTAASRVLAFGAPATASAGRSAVIAASPIVVNSALVGVALVSEAVTNSVPGIASLAVSSWFGGFIVLVAALAGWILAGALARPIATLTDDARSVALGSPTTSPPSRRAFPEVATLSAAIQGLAGRRHRGEELVTEQKEALRALSHRVSHQLRTPLAILRLRTEDLTDPDLPADQRDLLAGVVADQIDRLDCLGAELAELDPARWQLQTQDVDIAALVAKVVARNVPLASWGGVSLSSGDGAGGPIIVAIDPTLIEDAVSNVVHNAIKYTPRGGRIETTVTRRRNEVVVAVADTGPGFHPIEREDVLHAGVRGRASVATPGSGHGLGLVADALTRHGGRVELGDNGGSGAVVSLVLPAPCRGDDESALTTLVAMEQHRQ
jgi:signal transduction histidine kinase